jgi:hypothetical protein
LSAAAVIRPAIAEPRSSASSNEDAITRLRGAILPEQNAEWAVQRSRYTTRETLAPLSDDPIARLSAVTALTNPALAGAARKSRHCALTWHCR